MAFDLKKYTPPDLSDERFENAPDARTETVTRDGVAPDGYHAMSIYPEYFKIGGEWLLAMESRMDCVPVVKDGPGMDGTGQRHIEVIEFRHLKAGDAVICGRTEDASEGIFLWADGFVTEGEHPETFAFRGKRTRETAFSRDYDEIYELLRYEREHGHILWVMGPAVSFDYDARDAFSAIIAGGYAHAVLAGNALATHDLEGAYLRTALGQDIYTQKNMPNGHYNHLDLLNRVRYYGDIPTFIREENVDNGIICSCVKHGVPFVLGGSIRDDGPLPEVFGNVYEAQDAMRAHARKATTVICMATMLHTIAVGNMTPSYRVQPDGTVRQVYFYCVDVSEFMVNKLADRGSLSSRGIVTNVQDFIVNIAKGLGVR